MIYKVYTEQLNLLSGIIAFFLLCRFKLGKAKWACCFTACASELRVRIFHSLEAGIAIAISSFKWMKNNAIYEK